MERFVDVPGGRILAAEEGSGPPIVLIHAAIVDLRSWDELAPMLAAAGYRVIRYDMRGFGRTVTEDVEFNPRSDLLAVIDAFGVGRAAMVGNSLGGSVALETAIESPDRVVAVVTLGSGPAGFEAGLTPVERDLFEEGDRLQSARPQDADALADLLVRVWVDGPGQPADRVPAAIRESVLEAARRQFLPGYVAGRRQRLSPPANDRLADLGCPTLAVVGALDLTELVAAAGRLEEAAVDARAVVWPDVAHMVAMEQPRRLASLVTEFLAPLGPWS
jgi:3-oxoadipate enol-lactonase